MADEAFVLTKKMTNLFAKVTKLIILDGPNPKRENTYLLFFSCFEKVLHTRIILYLMATHLMSKSLAVANLDKFLKSTSNESVMELFGLNCIKKLTNTLILF